MTDQLQIPTSLGTSDADHIRLLGQDVAADLMGQVGFGELAFWLVTLRRPRVLPDGKPGLNALPPRYAAVETTPLKAKVNAGARFEMTLELTSKEARP